MATIQLVNTFSICPEGVHIFRIYDVEYDETFGKMLVRMVNAKGITHTERFMLLGADNQPNAGAMRAFSFFAKTALNNDTLGEIDHRDLINRYIKAEIKHKTSPSRNNPGETETFANLGDKWVADGFDTEPVKRAMELGTKKEQPSDNVDLDAMLN
jgi:hypothetical protein